MFLIFSSDRLSLVRFSFFRKRIIQLRECSFSDGFQALPDFRTAGDLLQWLRPFLGHCNHRLVWLQRIETVFLRQAAEEASAGGRLD